MCVKFKEERNVGEEAGGSGWPEETLMGGRGKGLCAVLPDLIWRAMESR